MNEVILSGLGILLALCGMTVLIFRRVSPIIVGPLAALLVTVMSGLPVLDSVTGTYVQGVGSFFVSYFMIFLLGNILGSLYQISGAAAKIGETVVRWFGAKNCMVACLISAALLSYGGINSFVIIFAIYPIALKLFEEADLPTYLLPGIVCGGMWTFAMTGPFSPQICNIVSMQSLGTPSYAGLIPGLAASVVMAVLIVWYMNRQAKKAKGRGEHFTPPEGGVRQHEGPTPGAVVSFIPLTAVIVLFNVTEIGIVACLLIGIVLSLGLFWRSIPWGEMLSTMNQAAGSSVTVIINTATIVGFGAVAKITPFYAWAVELLEASTANPYVVAAVGRKIAKEHRKAQTPHGKQSVRKLMGHGGDTNAIEVDTPKLFDKVARKWGVDYAIRRVGDEKYLLLFKARQADAITGCFAEYSRLELKRAKSRQTPIREQLRQAEEQVKKQPQRELTKEAAHGDR